MLQFMVDIALVGALLFLGGAIWRLGTILDHRATLPVSASAP